MSSVDSDIKVLNARLAALCSASKGTLFVRDRFCETTRNVIFATTGKSGTVILLSVEEIKKVIEILEVM